MTKVFAKSNMMSNDVQSYVVSAKFYDAEGNAAEINDGAFLVLGDHDDNVVYGTKDYNVYKAAAPTADNQVVVVVDLDGISQGVIAGNNYKIGQKTTDLICRPGFPFRVRRLAMYDQFWLGEGCFTEAPNGKAYATCVGGDTRLAPTSDMPYGGKFGIKIVATQDMNIGQTVNKRGDGYEQMYLCEVISLRS